jgi:uncharacterized Zn-binding protein involved in type VI secretion
MAALPTNGTPSTDPLEPRPEETPSEDGGRSAAREGDLVVGIDIHIIDVSTPAGPVPTPTPHPFKGKLDRELSGDVKIEDKPAATKGSFATNDPGHTPIGGAFHKTPKDEAEVVKGGDSVLVNDKPIARMGDVCMSCSDPVDLPTAVVIAGSSVKVGDPPPAGPPGQPDDQR